LLQVGDARPAGCEARVKVPTKYVTGETRTLRTVNAINGDLIKVALNPAFAGGLPGGGDWDPVERPLPAQRGAAARARDMTSGDIGRGVRHGADKAGCHGVPFTLCTPCVFHTRRDLCDSWKSPDAYLRNHGSECTALRQGRPGAAAV